MLMQMRLISEGKIISCEEKNGITAVLLATSERIRQETAVDRIAFEMGSDLSFRKIDFYFIDGAQYKQYSLGNIKLIVRQNSASLIKKGPVAEVLNSDGEINPKYQGFKIIDRR